MAKMDKMLQTDIAHIGSQGITHYLMSKFDLTNSRQTILLAAGSLIAYSLFRKTAAASDLVFFPKGIQGIKWENGSPVIDLNLGIGNVSNQDFKINAVSGYLYTNKTYIGYVGSFIPVTVRPASEATLPVRVRLSLIGIVSQLIDGITNKTWTQDLELELKANIDRLVVPVPTIKYKIGK